MASEREKAKDEYLKLREQGDKVAKKVSYSQLWVSIHYMLFCGGIILAAIVVLFAKWDGFTATRRVLAIVIAVAAEIVMLLLGKIPTAKNLKNKKDLDDIQRQLATLEDKYHL